MTFYFVFLPVRLCFLFLYFLPFSFRRSVRAMATPQDKFDNTKPLAIEAMNKTSFGRWMAEAHNEVVSLIPLLIFLRFDYSGQQSHQLRTRQTCPDYDKAVFIWLYFCWDSPPKSGPT